MSVALAQPKAAPPPEDAPVQREAIVLADAAKRIMREDVYIRARDGLRASYLDRLAKADPTNSELIMQLQATIRAIDGLDAELMKFTHGATRPRQIAV